MSLASDLGRRRGWDDSRAPERTPPGQPARFHGRRRWYTVATVGKTWRLQTAWWRGDDERVDRHDHKVVPREGMICVGVHVRVAEVWCLEPADD